MLRVRCLRIFSFLGLSHTWTLVKEGQSTPSLLWHRNQMIMWFQLNTCPDNCLITPNWLVVPARADLLVSAVLSDMMLFVLNCTLVHGLSPGSPTILTSCYWLMFQLGLRQINCVFSGRKIQTPHGNQLDPELCPAKHSDLQAVWADDLGPHLAMANKDTLGYSLCNSNVWPLPANQFPELFCLLTRVISVHMNFQTLNAPCCTDKRQWSKTEKLYFHSLLMLS